MTRQCLTCGNKLAGETWRNVGSSAVYCSDACRGQGKQLEALPVARQVPTGKLRKAGRKVVDVQTQGDLLMADKITKGNLPQDQTELLTDDEDRTK